ncbi:hypothetical protein KP509_33G062000, partial [Ceratopteris richardii]
MKRKDLEIGRYAYSVIISVGLDSVVVFQDLFIRLLAVCGKLDEANLVFENTRHPTVHTWNAIISANTDLGKPDRAFELYHRMRKHCVELNKFIFLSVLRLCSNSNALDQGRVIHKEIRDMGLLSDVFVGNSLIDMYIKCESLHEAREVFDELSRDIVSWSIMIAGYAHAGFIMLAIELFLKLQNEGLMPNEVIFTCMAKFCEDIGILQLMHCQIVEGGFEEVIVIANALIDIYGKLSDLDAAIKIFQRLNDRDVVSWGAMISGLVHNVQILCALEFFDRLFDEAVHPTNVIFSSIIKACSRHRNLRKGRFIHCQALWNGLKSDLVVGNSLLDMYAKCSSSEEACLVFSSLPSRDDISWGAMFSVYAQQGQHLAAFTLLERMTCEGVKPNSVMFTAILKACGRSDAISSGRQIHDQILRHGYHQYDIVCGALIDMYVKCGSLIDAHKVFDSLSKQDIASWGALIAGYAQSGHFFSAFDLLQKMQLDGMKPDLSMFLSVLKANTDAKADEILTLHKQIIYWGYETDTCTMKQLIHLYNNISDMECGYKILNVLNSHDDDSSKILMSNYLQNGQEHRWLQHYVKMCQDGIRMDRLLVSYALKAVGIIRDIWGVQLLHHQVAEDGSESNAVIGSTLIEMYVKCCLLHDAHELLKKLPNRNAVVYGTMIAGYAQQGKGLAALELYEEMKSEGIEPNETIHVCCLKACGLAGALTPGKLVHRDVIIADIRTTYLESTLLEMYASCGSLEDAVKVFFDMSVQDVMSWELMISIFSQHGYSHSALKCFERMQHIGFKPRSPTFIYLLNACGDIGALEYGHWLHDQVIRNQCHSDLMIENAVIDCYAKCGSMKEAHNLFARLPAHNASSWTSLIQGYSSIGDAESAIYCLEAMQGEGMVLNETLYTNVLAACRHSGLLEAACHYFNQMNEAHGITPTTEHYNCLIDLLIRSGHILEAESILKGMHFPPDVVAWRSLLACFTTFQDRENSLQCFNKVSQLDPENGSAYALILNTSNSTLELTN